MFRGRQSGTYEFIPSALMHIIKLANQDSTEYVEPQGTPVYNSESEETQRFKEYYNLRLFFELSDSNNLRFPNVDRIRKCLFSYSNLGGGKKTDR